MILTNLQTNDKFRSMGPYNGKRLIEENIIFKPIVDSCSESDSDSDEDKEEENKVKPKSIAHYRMITD